MLKNIYSKLILHVTIKSYNSKIYCKFNVAILLKFNQRYILNLQRNYSLVLLHKSFFLDSPIFYYPNYCFSVCLSLSYPLHHINSYPIRTKVAVNLRKFVHREFEHKIFY